MNPFERLHTIPSEVPGLNEDNWCEHQPCWRLQLSGRDVLISQPLSSFFVHLLGVLTLFVALRFWLLSEGQQSRQWWSISLAFWGLGAILAGVSYQTFGFQIKCQGRERCSWTSWWEVIYLLLQQFSLNAMLVAVAHSCLSGPLTDLATKFALLVSVAYSSSLIFGAFAPQKSLITFERMLLWCLPILSMMILVNGYRYNLAGEELDYRLLQTWAGVLLSLWAYWVYWKMGIGKLLWARGIWFSENDVLHVTLIYWVLFINRDVLPFVVDLR